MTKTKIPPTVPISGVSFVLRISQNVVGIDIRCYYENNEGAKLKRIIRICRSQAKKFIDNFATREELIELKEKIEEKLNE